jgi:hypothetical protein
MQIVSVDLGAGLLFFGRALFWVFVAIAGFLLGMALGDEWFAGQSEWAQFAVAIAAGAIGALVAIVAQRFDFSLGGFYAGGYVALNIAAHFHQQQNLTLWFIVGGVIGGIIAAMMMDWAIIVLSSLAGAVAIISAFEDQFDSTAKAVLVVGIAAVGIAVQGRRLSRNALSSPSA